MIESERLDVLVPEPLEDEEVLNSSFSSSLLAHADIKVAVHTTMNNQYNTLFILFLSIN